MYLTVERREYHVNNNNRSVFICNGGLRAETFCLASGRGCCGGSGQPYIPKVKVRDRNRFHYPYHTSLKVSGMSSGNSAVCVENALNSMEGVWAKVNLLNEKVSIYMKQEVNEAALRIVLKDAGYAVSRETEYGAAEL